MATTTPRSDDRPAHAATGGGLHSLGRYTYWSLVGAVLVLLLMPAITGPVPRPPDPVGTVAFAGMLVVGLAVLRLTERFVPRKPGAPPVPWAQWRRWAVAGGVAALVVASVSVAAGDMILWAFAPAVIASLLMAGLPRRVRPVAVAAAVLLAVAAGAAIALLTGDALQLGYPVGGAAVMGCVAFLTLASIWTWDVAVQLDAARRKAATLAVANERLRFAADLHDIQGHHLQVIALKSELASRLLRADPDAAACEMAAVHELAADALRDTRAVVHGYRRATVDAEIANASNVLASAGIDARLHVDPDVQAGALPEESRHLLGLVLREAVTNVLRHSSAAHAYVTLERDERVRLTVANDGVDQRAPLGAGGLRDLAERVHAAGGALTWERSDGWFAVRAALPAGQDAGPTDDPHAGAADAPGATDAPGPAAAADAADAPEGESPLPQSARRRPSGGPR